jgi:hypothetical protein
MTPEMRERIVEELLRGAAVNRGHAYEMVAELEDALDGYRQEAELQRQAREQIPRERKGRPTDVVERQFEARVVEIVGHGGPDTATAPAAVILDLMRQAAGVDSSDPRNALRRAERRLRTLFRRS